MISHGLEESLAQHLDVAFGSAEEADDRHVIQMTLHDMRSVVDRETSYCAAVVRKPAIRVESYLDGLQAEPLHLLVGGADGSRDSSSIDRSTLRGKAIDCLPLLCCFRVLGQYVGHSVPNRQPGPRASGSSTPRRARRSSQGPLQFV